MMNSRLARWTMYFLVAAVFAVVCVFLANWQLDRNEWRNAQIELVEQNYDAAPVPLDDVIRTDGAFDPSDEWRPITISGRYASDDQLLVRNRPHGGTSAFEVLVPFHTDDGRILIINRGWVLPGEGAVPEVPSAPDGRLTLTARLRPGEPLPASGRTAPEGQVPTIHLPTIAGFAGAPTIETAYGELISEAPPAEQAPMGFDAPTEDPGPHFSYAIQWILFAIMGFVFIAYMIRTEVTKAREERQGATHKRTKRRRDRDADAEDELLDAQV